MVFGGQGAKPLPLQWSGLVEKRGKARNEKVKFLRGRAAASREANSVSEIFKIKKNICAAKHIC